MNWFEFLIPAVVIALGVRFEAMLLDPYWSWVELFPEMMPESGETQRTRLESLARRLAIPAIVAFILTLAWGDLYAPTDLMVVGAAGAGLLMWPMVFHGLPLEVRTETWEVPALYLLLPAAFAASAWTGGDIAQWVEAQGGLSTFVRENLYGSVIGGAVTLFLGGWFQALATRASKKHQSHW